MRFYGINFPLRDSEEGFYVKLTVTDKEAVKSNLLHLLLTKKGSRLYRPEFGTDIWKYLFEPMDVTTLESIQNEIVLAVQTNFMGINIDNVVVTPNYEDLAVNIRMDFSYNEGFFTYRDDLNLTLPRS
jgi:phage baseplate assembly protein W